MYYHSLYLVFLLIMNTTQKQIIKLYVIVYVQPRDMNLFLLTVLPFGFAYELIIRITSLWSFVVNAVAATSAQKLIL